MKLVRQLSFIEVLALPVALMAPSAASATSPQALGRSRTPNLLIRSRGPLVSTGAGGSGHAHFVLRGPPTASGRCADVSGGACSSVSSLVSNHLTIAHQSRRQRGRDPGELVHQQQGRGEPIEPQMPVEHRNLSWRA